jgi:hypothetical protein
MVYSENSDGERLYTNESSSWLTLQNNTIALFGCFFAKMLLYMCG